MRHGKLGLFLLVCVLAAADSPAANWARFRGPNGTGVAADTDIPVQWQDKNILWKTELPGVGNSSPVIWGDKLFLQSADAKNRLFICVNIKDGQILWTKSEPGDVAPKGKMNARNSLASSTPATDGERVYFYVWDGAAVSMSAYDFKGNRVWRRVLGDWDSQHGPGTSPMIFEDKVIIMNDMDGKAEVIALDGKTGQPAWQVPRPPFRACYSTPFLFERQGKPVPELIVSSTAGVASYNPKTGSENWKWEWSWAGEKMALRTVASHIAHQGLIFVNSGDGSGARHTVVIKDDGSAKVWEEKKTLPYVPAFLARGNYLFYVNDRGVAGCLEAKTGKELWSERLPGGGGVTASPILIGDKIYSVGEDGTVVVYEAGPVWKKLADNKIPEGVWASPAVAANKLFIRGRTTLYCIGK